MPLPEFRSQRYRGLERNQVVNPMGVTSPSPEGTLFETMLADCRAFRMTQPVDGE